MKDEFLHEKEEDMAGFLGLDIIHSTDRNIIILTHMGLIDWILKVTSMENSNPKYTHAETNPLQKIHRWGSL